MMITLSPQARRELRAVLMEAAERSGPRISGYDARPMRVPDYAKMIGWITAAASEPGECRELEDAICRAAGVPTTAEFFEEMRASATINPESTNG